MRQLVFNAHFQAIPITEFSLVQFYELIMILFSDTIMAFQKKGDAFSLFGKCFLLGKESAVENKECNEYK